MVIDLRHSLQSLLNSFIDFVYPPLCLSCRKLMEQGREQVCPDCWNSIRVVTRHLPLFIETESKLIDSGVVDSLVSLYVFEKEGVFQIVVHNLKYGGMQALGLELGRRLGRVVVERGIHADGVIPIPLHKRKLRERGYNQAELIGRGLSEVIGIPIRTDVIRRKKYTATQTMLTLDKRRNNMEDAFEVVPRVRDEVRKKAFILVDDVITTGATIESCAQELLAHGAGKIIAVSVALAQRDTGS